MYNKISFYHILPAIILSVFVVVAFTSAWTEPSSAPPSSNVPAPVNVGTTTQVKAGSLVVGGAAFETYYRTILATLGDAVGIGTSNPTKLLTIGDATGTSAAMANGVFINFNDRGGYYVRDSVVGIEGKFEVDNQRLGIGTMTAHPVDIWTDNGQQVTILTNGHVGIRDVNPSAMLTIGGAAGVDGIKFPDGTLQTTAAGGGGGNQILDGYLSVRNGTSTGGDMIKWANDKFIHTTGPASTYMGWNAGNGTTTGWSNSGFGYNALVSITSGGYNTAMGDSALFYTTTGGFNTALGYYSMQSNRTGIYNTAVGDETLQWNTTGSWNTALGAGTLPFNTVENGNTALGYSAGVKPSGSLLLTSGSYNLFVGYRAGPSTSTLRNATAIGPNAQVAQSNTMILGSTGSDIVNVGIGATTSNERLEVNGGVRLNTTAAKPACSATKRGTFWVTQGAAGVKDAVEVCAKDAANVYAWRVIY